MSTGQCPVARELGIPKLIFSGNSFVFHKSCSLFERRERYVASESKSRRVGSDQSAASW
jgi:hypothetical protein